MRLNDINSIFFIGIGGIGMSALARYFNFRGKQVSGYDKTNTALTSDLENEGIYITYEDSLDTLAKDADLIVYTPAVPTNHLQLNYYRNNNFTVKKRSEVLGLIANELFNISIAGSHGKTSTSSLTAYLLKSANKDTAAFLGGLALNFNSNFIDGNTYAVVEADEFDRSFLQLQPNITLVTSIDTDHLEIYGNLKSIQDSFSQFLSQVRDGGTIFLHQSIDQIKLKEGIVCKTYSYDNQLSDFFASNIRVSEGTTRFDLNTPKGTITDLVLNYGGQHNVENAIGASAIALEIGVSTQDLKHGLATYKGVKRRFQIIHKSEQNILVDDYAHHPREIDAVIRTARDLYPNKHLTVVFQPHLFSRTRDLTEEFSQSLSQADSIVLLPIYPARELPIDGISSELILNKISIQDKAIVDKNDLLDYLSKKEPQGVIMTLGAGNIDTAVTPISNWLKSMNK